MIKQVLPESYNADMDDGEGHQYVYDKASRLIQIQNPDGNLLHTYAYNGKGQIIRETDAEDQEILYTYNGLGQLTKEQTSLRREDNTTYYRVKTYTYDNAGNKIEEAYGQQEAEKDQNPIS